MYIYIYIIRELFQFLSVIINHKISIFQYCTPYVKYFLSRSVHTQSRIPSFSHILFKKVFVAIVKAYVINRVSQNMNK